MKTKTPGAPTHLSQAMPVQASERFAVLDVMRGLALLGIVLANFPEFALYTFLSDDAAAALPTAQADGVVRYIMYVLVDGKFYTIFSLLFGVGFSIIIGNAERRGANGMRIFYRRMTVLALIGLAHLLLLWSGDILMLYAVAGMLLPLFRRMSDRRLLLLASALLILPVATDAMVELTGVRPSAVFTALQWRLCGIYGITEDNFAYWLRDARGYEGVSQFLMQGAFERMYEFVEGNRFFKVLGLFIIGFWMGRNRMYANLADRRPVLRKIALWGTVWGLPLSLVYAWSAVCGRPWGQTAHSLLYLVSVFPLGFAYVAAICLCFLRHPRLGLFRLAAAPGRMALSCYIGQSVAGIILFYGIGFGLGAGIGLSVVVPISVGVYVVEALLCAAWLRAFRYGPLEWGWRMLTYGRVFSLRK